MTDKPLVNWIQAGMAISLGLAILFLFRKKWQMARLAGRFGLAFLEKWKESKSSQELGPLLAKLQSEAGRKS